MPRALEVTLVHEPDNGDAIYTTASDEVPTAPASTPMPAAPAGSSSTASTQTFEDFPWAPPSAEVLSQQTKAASAAAADARRLATEGKDAMLNALKEEGKHRKESEKKAAEGQAELAHDLLDCMAEESDEHSASLRQTEKNLHKTNKEVASLKSATEGNQRRCGNLDNRVTYVQDQGAENLERVERNLTGKIAGARSEQYASLIAAFAQLTAYTLGGVAYASGVEDWEDEMPVFLAYATGCTLWTTGDIACKKAFSGKGLVPTLGEMLQHLYASVAGAVPPAAEVAEIATEVAVAAEAFPENLGIDYEAADRELREQQEAEDKVVDRNGQGRKKKDRRSRDKPTGKKAD